MPRLPPRAKPKKAIGATQDKASKFHASREWGAIRESYRQIQPICERCKYLKKVTQESTRNLSVHHIIMVARCWELRKQESNFLTLCNKCHSYFSTLERNGQVNKAETEGQEIKNGR